MGCAHFQPRPIAPSETAASLEGRTLDDPAFKAFLGKNLHRAFEEWPLKSWDFESLNLAALYFNSSLDVARAQWQVALGGTKTAAARPNPTLNAVPGYDFSATDGLSPWIPAVTFDLPIETAGKRGYRKAEARHLSESARLNIAATAWQVRSNLRSSLIDFSAARKRETLLQNQRSAQEKIAVALDQQFQAGAISRAELTLARIALDKIRLDLADAQQVRVEARVRIADSIGVPAKALDRVELIYDLASRSSDARVWMSDAVRSQALQTRADILGALAEYSAKQSALQLQIAKQYPDLHLGPGYQFDQGDHKFSLSVTAELPVLNQNQGPIAEAEARRSEAAARFLALQSKIISEIDRAVAIYQVAQENLSTLESLAASQKKRSEIVEAQVKAGAADQIEFLNSQIELTAAQLLQLNGQIKLHQAIAALEDAVQRPIDTMQPMLIEQSQRPQTFLESKP